MMVPDTLLILDYSGTLSLEMPRFARPDNLRRALQDTGLAAIGVTGPEVFWKEIVNPTWVEGSTTQRGYKRVMAERIAALGLAPGASAGEIAEAASRFVQSYLDHSRIAPDWRPLLARLGENPDISVIVATDHYAEATGKIIAELGAWGIPAVKVGAEPDCETPIPREAAVRRAPPCRRPFFIANSADLGVWKVDAAFWEILKKKLRQGKVERLLVVDDFGFNEEVGDSYGGEAAEIAARREQTRETLRTVFEAEAEVIPFFLEKKQTGREAESARLIAETALRIDRFLEQQWGGNPMDANGCKPKIDYPCPWVYKVMGRDVELLNRAIAEVVGGSEHTVTLSRTSKGGAYHCLNVTLTVESEPVRLDLYQRLCRHPDILIVM